VYETCVCVFVCMCVWLGLRLCHCVCVRVQECARVQDNTLKFQQPEIKLVSGRSGLKHTDSSIGVRVELSTAMADQVLRDAYLDAFSEVWNHFWSFHWSDQRARDRLMQTPPTAFERDASAVVDEQGERRHREWRSRRAAAGGDRQDRAAAEERRSRQRSRSRRRRLERAAARARRFGVQGDPRPPSPSSECRIAFREGFRAALDQMHDAAGMLEAMSAADVRRLRDLQGYASPGQLVAAAAAAAAEATDSELAERIYMQQRLAHVEACRSIVAGEFLRTRCINCRGCRCVALQRHMIMTSSMSDLACGAWRYVIALPITNPDRLRAVYGQRTANEILMELGREPPEP
jgi:hypothetical protein